MILEPTASDEIRLIAVRHGESEANAARRYSGTVDTPLTARGIEQAKALALRLRHVSFDAMYCSDLSRARDTADAIAAHHGFEPIVDPILRERDYGILENLPYDVAREQFPECFEHLEAFDTSYPLPGGESADQVRERLATFVRLLLRNHLGQTIVAVAHGGILRTLFWQLMDVPFQAARRAWCDNTAVCSFRLHRNAWTLELWNDTRHLSPCLDGTTRPA